MSGFEAAAFFDRVKVPSGWTNSQQLVDLLRSTAQRGETIGIDKIDTLLSALVASQLEVINAFGVREAQNAELKESLKSIGDLFKAKPKGK